MGLREQGEGRADGEPEREGAVDQRGEERRCNRYPDRVEREREPCFHAARPSRRQRQRSDCEARGVREHQRHGMRMDAEGPQRGVQDEDVAGPVEREAEECRRMRKGPAQQVPHDHDPADRVCEHRATGVLEPARPRPGVRSSSTAPEAAVT